MTDFTTKVHWSYDYIGLPWARRGSVRSGVSCLGLRDLVFRDVLKVDLVTYNEEVSFGECNEITSLQQGQDIRPWVEVDPAEAREFDCVTFRLRGLDSHLGVIVGRGCMLHVSEGTSSRIERFDVEPWLSLSPRFYRHVPWTPKALAKVPAVNSPIVLPTLDRVDMAVTIPEGTTILGAVKLVFPGITEKAFECLRVTIGCHEITVDYWKNVTPKRWDIVVIRVVPGVSNLLRVVLSIAVLIGAAAISGGALGALAPATGLFAGWLGAGTVSAGLLGAVVGIGGSLLINALIPTRKAQEPWWDKLPVYNVSGFSNALNADGTVPSVLGQVRFAPPFAALPYNFNYAGFRYATAIFLIGYGPVQISDIMIGNTPIANYQGVAIEIREGWPTDGPITLYPSQVIEDSDNPLDLPNSIGSQRRVTAVNVTSAEVEVYFGSGLIAYDQNAQPQVMGVLFNLQWRLLGTSTWTATFFNVFNETTRAFWTSYGITFPVRGQYEVMLTRATADFDEFTFQGAIRYVTKSTWSALRSFRPEYPLNYSKPMALLCLRIQASAQLGGTIQGVSVMARRVAPDWDAGSNSWITRVTSNPASLYRYVLQGPENAYPRTDSQIDLPDIQDWALYNSGVGLEYNAVHQSDESQDSVLEAVASGGRALPHDRGDKWSVIIDRPRTVFAGHITPANSSGFTHTNPKVDFPDAFTVPFADETNDFIPTKRVVPWPGHTGPIVISQELALPGKTDPNEVWREARRRQYEASLRQDSYTVDMDIEQLGFSRGDAIIVSHPVLNRRQTAGYITSVSPDGLTITFDGLVTIESGPTYQIRVRKVDGSSFIGFVTEPPAEAISTIHLSSATGTASVGDLIMVGETATITKECIIKAVQPGDNFTAALSLIDHAPSLDTLAASESPPVWDGIIGGAADYGPAVAPGTPIINSIASGASTDWLASSTDPHPIAVFIVPAAPDIPFSGSLTVRYKANSSSTWIVGPTILPSDNYAIVPGFNDGDLVDLSAKATRNGLDSAWSPTITTQNSSNAAPYWVPAEKQLADLYVDFTTPHSGGGDYGMAWMQKQNREVSALSILSMINGASIGGAGGGLFVNGSQRADFTDLTWLILSQPGTFWVQYETTSLSGNQNAMQARNANEMISLWVNVGTPKISFTDTAGSLVYDRTAGGALSIGARRSHAITWDSLHAGGVFATVPTSRSTFGSALSLAVPSAVSLGSRTDGVDGFVGRIIRFAYFQNIFSDAQLTALG